MCKDRETAIAFLLNLANQCLCLPLFRSVVSDPETIAAVRKLEAAHGDGWQEHWVRERARIDLNGYYAGFEATAAAK
jgi:hypothetical protein